MRRILDVARARQLVAALSVFPPALAVSLTGDCPVAGSRLPDASGCEHEVDVRETVLDALRVMFHAACMQEHGRFGLSPDLRGFDDTGCGNACDRFGESRRVFRDYFPDLIESQRMVVDE